MSLLLAASGCQGLFFKWFCIQAMIFLAPWFAHADDNTNNMCYSALDFGTSTNNKGHFENPYKSLFREPSAIQIYKIKVGRFQARDNSFFNGLHRLFNDVYSFFNDLYSFVHDPYSFFNDLYSLFNDSYSFFQWFVQFVQWFVNQWL